MYFKKFLKQILNSLVIQWIIAMILYTYLIFTFYTSRKYYIYSPRFDKDAFERKNAIYAFWHNRLSMMNFLRPRKIKTFTISSAHKDGRIAVFVSKIFGVQSIAGSTNKMSIQSVKEMLGTLKSGNSISITPDGPKGPKYEINSNITRIAAQTNKSIIPLSFTSSNKMTFNSWDKFILPLPFGNLFFIYGNPIKVADKDFDQDKVSLTLKNELNRISQIVDQKAAK